MTSKRLIEQPRAGDTTHEGGSVGQCEPVIAMMIAARENGALHGNAFKMNEGALKSLVKEISPNGHFYTPTRERHYIHKKVSDYLNFSRILRRVY